MKDRDDLFDRFNPFQAPQQTGNPELDRQLSLHGNDKSIDYPKLPGPWNLDDRCALVRTDQTWPLFCLVSNRKIDSVDSESLSMKKPFFTIEQQELFILKSFPVILIAGIVLSLLWSIAWEFLLIFGVITLFLSVIEAWSYPFSTVRLDVPIDRQIQLQHNQSINRSILFYFLSIVFAIAGLAVLWIHFENVALWQDSIRYLIAIILALLAVRLLFLCSKVRSTSTLSNLNAVRLIDDLHLIKGVHPDYLRRLNKWETEDKDESVRLMEFVAITNEQVVNPSA